MTVTGIGITATRLDVMCKKKVMSVVVFCQRQTRHRKGSILIHFEDDAGMIVNVKKAMKDSSIPVNQEHLGEVSKQVNMIVVDDRQSKEA